MKYLIACLGNIGAEYDETRHNIGFKIADRLAKDLEKGVQYKVVAHLTGEFTDEQAENISNMVSTQIRKKFNKMQVISMSRNTFDLLVYADPDAYTCSVACVSALATIFREVAKLISFWANGNLQKNLSLTKKPTKPSRSSKVSSPKGRIGR